MVIPENYDAKRVHRHPVTFSLWAPRGDLVEKNC
jgi:hypothetical protein